MRRRGAGTKFTCFTGTKVQILTQLVEEQLALSILQQRRVPVFQSPSDYSMCTVALVGVKQRRLCSRSVANYTSESRTRLLVMYLARLKRLPSINTSLIFTNVSH
jgi:hypothetical protein